MIHAATVLDYMSPRDLALIVMVMLTLIGWGLARRDHSKAAAAPAVIALLAWVVAWLAPDFEARLWAAVVGIGATLVLLIMGVTGKNGRWLKW